MSFTPDFQISTVLFGGSFDPLHLGHLALARGVERGVANVGQVVFVPSYLSPGKSPTGVNPAERLRLLHVGLEDTPYKIWDFEILRPAPSFTIETLREAARLGAKREKLFLLVGADAYADLPRWKEAALLRNYAQIVVGNRPGHPLRPWQKDDIIIEIEPHPLASHEIRDSLKKGKVPEQSMPDSLETEFESLFLNSKNPYVK